MYVYIYIYITKLNLSPRSYRLPHSLPFSRTSADDPRVVEAWVVGGHAHKPKIMTSAGDLEALAQRVADLEALLEKAQQRRQQI
jgi:hypothetical protein